MHKPAMTGRIALALALALALWPISSPAAAAGTNRTGSDLDVDLEDLRPGLVAHYRSLAEPEAALHRIDPRPTFYVAHSSPHPRIPPGPFEVVWSGVLHIKEPGPIKLDAYACGEVLVEIDGVKVLAGRGKKETSLLRGVQELTRPTGMYRLKIRYRSLADRPARLQIWWQGPGFTREPIPAWHFKHVAAEVPVGVVQEQLVEKGRKLVERLGCARCHAGALPGVTASMPGPSLADVSSRVSRGWFMEWLADPVKMRHDARMPALFPVDREGFVERWVLAEYLLGAGAKELAESRPAGDHRMGRRRFVELGCAACHFLPDAGRSPQPDLERTEVTGLRERLPADSFAAFLGNPHTRYPDGRMPRLPLTPQTARDISAYVLLWSQPAAKKISAAPPPTSVEIAALSRRLKGRGVAETAQKLLHERGCVQCHPGLGQSVPRDVPLVAGNVERGCLSGKSGPRFQLDAETRKAITAFLVVARKERHPSPFAGRQRLLEHLGCVRCHARDSERPPPIEAIGSTLGGAWLQEVPFQRTPRLYYPLHKYERSYLVRAIREGVSGIRAARYSYRMPAFGDHAETLVQALAEADGDLPTGPASPERPVKDPTLGPLAGPSLAGFQGYACVSCHVWNGRAFSEPDPGAIGTDLTRLAGRIRRDWFDRFLEGPARFNPATVMPAIFMKGKPATLSSVLDGNPERQRDALWSYFALGAKAPAPTPPPPLPVAGPARGEPVLVALIPIETPDGKLVESITLLSDRHDLIVYDVTAGLIHSGYTGGRILRKVQGRSRSFHASGTPMGNMKVESPWPKLGKDRRLRGYDRLNDGVRLRWILDTPAGPLAVTEELRLFNESTRRGLNRELCAGDKLLQGTQHLFPPAQTPPVDKLTILPDPGKIEGTLERPGYRAVTYPRPKTITGEDRIMPSAIAINPRDGRVFVASMKTGELFVLHDPRGDGKGARFENYAHGLFEEAFSMLAEPDALYVLHRRNLTRIRDEGGKAKHFERIALLPHGIANTYDYAYGLARDNTGGFVLSFAPYANRHLSGSGSAIRLPKSSRLRKSGEEFEEIAFGFRNPVGWCAGPDGEIFFTDNQGEWVATNKLCHLSPGRFYGFPNSAQRQHANKPPGKAAVWVPYGWAKSVNGVAYNNTGDRFGPFGGQIFMAELMFGGAIIRANLEKVNGEYQGACFPFWGKGLLGPLSLAFDPRGSLWVGGITEPGWMAQPDRGALFRIDFTGAVPFEMKSIHALPQGFRIVLTKPVSAPSARDPASYQIEHYRYEYTGAYGSPELERGRLPIRKIELAPDGRSVYLTTAPLIKGRVYLIEARAVRSAAGEGLVHPEGAYTMNEVPDR